MRKIYLVASVILLCAGTAMAQRSQRSVSLTPLFNKLPKAKIAPFENRASAGCDTINYPIPDEWNLTLYGVTDEEGGGFLTGTNGYGDLQKAAYFDASDLGDSYLLKAYIYFAVANSNTAANLSKVVAINVYDGTLDDGPGNLVATVNKTLAQLKADVDGGFFTQVTFPTPIALSSTKEFFISVDMSNLTWDNSATIGAVRDSLAVVSTTDGDTYSDYNGWLVEQWDNRTWSLGVDAWGLDLNLAIFPIVGASPDCGALPITLSSFTGERSTAKNVLKWVTQTEFNSKGFEIQRSADGVNFTTIGYANTKASSGNSTGTLVYNFEDTKPFYGSGYYRLKQIDKDGKFSLSSVVLIKGVKGSALQMGVVYPNPVRNMLNVVLSAPATTKVTVSIADMAGKVVMQKSLQAASGDNNVGLDVSKLSAGSYILKVDANDGSKSSSSRFVKQ